MKALRNSRLLATPARPARDLRRRLAVAISLLAGAAAIAFVLWVREPGSAPALPDVAYPPEPVAFGVPSGDATPAAPAIDPSRVTVERLPDDDARAAGGESPAGAATREGMRAAIPQFLAQHASGRTLKSGEIESLLDALERSRIAYEEIARLGDAPENAARVAELRGEAERAGNEARQIAGIQASLGDFVGALGRSGFKEP